GGLLIMVIYRRLKAARAARALEKAIAQQAQEQVAETRPEDRPEVLELQRQMMEGFKALKTSALGEGRNPLYELPWYAIVGPPGAGKTTALRHSGLSFPYLDPTGGGGVRGVGGTRNCDWWFTSEAILLDTAGRYTTDVDDQDEWFAFLTMLRTYRKQMPLNGIVVAVSIEDLIRGTEDEVERIASKVRDRIDEMQDRLKTELPVYLLFTKSDLVAGFVEFFGDLKRSERGQPWGATFALSQDKTRPGELFDAEFDLIVQQLHQRSVHRLSRGREAREERELVYQFPLEFASIKRSLSDFVATCFEPTPPARDKKAKRVPTPMLRGFYFTSGTQEGNLLDSVVGAMAKGFGLRPTQKQESKKGDPKSYFLKEVFTDIIFPDQDVAARSEDETTRVRRQGILLLAGAALISGLFTIPAIRSYMQNRELVAETDQLTTATAAIDWKQGEAVGNLDELDRLRAQVQRLDQWREEGAPPGWRFAMYQGDRLFEPAKDQYINSLRKGFVAPVKEKLEKRLESATGRNYLQDYDNLKTYLLLNDQTHLQTNDQWEKGRLTQLWAEGLRRQATSLTDRELRDKVVPHVSYYVDLLRRGEIQGEELANPLVQKVRRNLQSIQTSRRYYDRFVTVLIDQKLDESGPNTRENLRYPPVTLNELYKDRPEVLTILNSRSKKRSGRWQRVEGPYTKEGHKAVLAALKNGAEILEREKWVVPIAAGERSQADRIELELERVRQDYDQAYITAWFEFFRDIEVKEPGNNLDAIDEYKILATPDWPYYRLLKALKDNTQFYKKEKSVGDEAKEGILDAVKRRARNRIDDFGDGAGDVIISDDKKEERIDPVPSKFESMVEFGVPTPPQENEPPPPSGLGEYVGELETLAAQLTLVEEGPPGQDPAQVAELFKTAKGKAETQLNGLDKTGQELMRDLLINPLEKGYQAMLKSAGGSASGLWETEVYKPFASTIRGRYPFSRTSTRDASFEDAVAFLKTKGRQQWGL
ncbi:MAG: type VI secretion system membrane subunit TssM, partial [Myxococcota bacterium]